MTKSQKLNIKSKPLDLADKLLREIMRDNRPFGGKVLVLGGDFR